MVLHIGTQLFDVRRLAVDFAEPLLELHLDLADGRRAFVQSRRGLATLTFEDGSKIPGDDGWVVIDGEEPEDFHPPVHSSTHKSG